MAADAPSLLAALAGEIGDVRSGVERVSGLLTDLVRRLPVEHRAEALTDAQALDALIQRLDAVSGVLNGLAEGKSSADAVSGVLLADVAERLQGATSARPSAVSGDLMLFD